MQQIRVCSTCHGRGQVIETPCAECGGRGHTEVEEAVTVTIPAGAKEGMVLQVPGLGEPSPTEEGVPGDLYVVIHSVPDPHFERRGADLWSTKAISIADAALGTILEVTTLEEPVAVSIPPGTQPGTIFPLPEKGLPELGDQRRGLLYLIVQVHVPEQLGPEERELYQQLRDLELRAGDDPRIVTYVSATE